MLFPLLHSALHVITQFSDNDGFVLAPGPSVCNTMTASNCCIIAHFLGSNQDPCFRNEYPFSYTLESQSIPKTTKIL